MSKRINTSLVVNGVTLVTEAAWNTELDDKQEKLAAWLKGQGLAAVLLRRNENVQWVTGGAATLNVCTAAETGTAAVLVTAAGKRYYLTTENEAPRAHDEEFGKTDFEPVLFPWYADETNTAAAKLAGGKLASDTPVNGATLVNLAPLREALCDAEIARYEWLCSESAAATVEALNQVEPGMNEYEMQALTEANLLRRGILPSVALYGVDERIYKYKHAVPRGAQLKNYGMLNLCSRRWGLVCSITRFVHFGKPPAELLERFQAAAAIHAALLDATREGATSAQLFAVVKNAFKVQGFEGDERCHHQGGAAGYGEREWVATPSGKEVVVNHQAFAWNPSVRGGKVEETVLLSDGKIQVLTATPALPSIDVTVNGVVYKNAGLLVK